MARMEDVRRWIGSTVAALLTIPPVTALLNIAMILVYFNRTKFEQLLEPKSSLSWRALLSALFYHKRELHLFLDLTWTLITGTRLEKLLGSWRFLHTTASMIFLSQGFTLLINLPHAYLTKYTPNITFCLQLSDYTLGFSGVLFALYFLLISSSHDHQLPIGQHNNNRNELLISSSHDHQIPIGQHNNNRHELLVEGLVVIAAFQALILPDAHFFNSLSGIVAGFVYVNSPSILGGVVVCGMAIYNETLHFMYFIIDHCEALYATFTNANGHYYGNNNNHHGQEGGFTNHYEYNDHEVEQEEDDQLDVHLEWECKACLSKNGVFFRLCEACTRPRT